MNSRSLPKFGGVLMIVLGTLTFGLPEAKALPFEQTPEGFIEYANTLTFDEGTKAYTFFNPRKCEVQYYTEFYNCAVDYKKISPLGTKTCINARIFYNHTDPNKRIGWLENPSECSDWEKISSTPEPEPQPQPTPPPQPQNSTTTSTPLDNNLILAGGAGILVAGGLLGIAFSKLLGRR